MTEMDDATVDADDHFQFEVDESSTAATPSGCSAATHCATSVLESRD